MTNNYEVKTTQIECPECGSTDATIYQQGHKFAGIYECNVCGYSDACPHAESHVEEAVVDYYDPGNYYGHGQREVPIYVCDLCEETLEGDPAADAAEARESAEVDAYIEEQALLR